MASKDNSVQAKLALLQLAKNLGSITEACKQTGYSRDSYYRFLELYKKGGKSALKEISKKKPNLKNRIEKNLESAVIQYAVQFPDHGQLRASRELAKKKIYIASSTIRSVWIRNDLETRKKRLKANKK